MFARRLRPIAAGARMRVDLRFQLLDQLSGLRQMRLQSRLAAKRRLAHRDANANAIMRKTIQIDHPCPAPHSAATLSLNKPSRNSPCATRKSLSVR